MSEPRPSDRHDASEPDDTFEEIVGEETQRDPDLAVIEAGSRTLRTYGGEIIYEQARRRGLTIP
ncbi:hypothetical protein I3W98_30720 [Streptomyces cavourensis]|nr:hypothetical protein [Streptomyces cavourensis]